VERKGIGHPDTICDALAEELSRKLSQYYLENFGLVLHHNVDKALLWGGISQPAFNGGAILSPMEIFLAGRATCDYKGKTVPLMELVTESCHNWLASHFHALDVEQHVKLHCLIRPGSADLVELYLRQQQTGVALANDTSCGVGYAPLSELEQVVLRVEKHLNSATFKRNHPETGEDIKVMGVAHEGAIDLTIACAYIDQYIANIDDYIDKKTKLVELVSQAVKNITNKTVNIKVNAADDIERESIYLTVTGTSAESGDDGEVGRGNRVNGLITPYRPMNMEAAAGKNPVTHVGKLYNIVAQQIAQTLLAELDDVQAACCYLLSQIGQPVSQPRIIDIRLDTGETALSEKLKKRVEEITNDKLQNIHITRHEIVTGKIQIY
jgi:S-adenosylmethionine synthetase